MDYRNAKLLSHGILMVSIGLSAAACGDSSLPATDGSSPDAAVAIVQEKAHWREGSCSGPLVPDAGSLATMTAPPAMMLPPGTPPPGSQPPQKLQHSRIDVACGAPFDTFLLQDCEARWSNFRMPEITCRGDGGRAWLNLRPTRHVDTQSLTLLIVGEGQEGSSYVGELRIGDEHTLLNVESGALGFLQPLPQDGELILDGHVLALTAKSAAGPACVECRIHLGSIITH